MGNASFVQTSFLGGEWSPRAQGRMTDPSYKAAMNVCLNGYPTEEGAWVRRSGFRFMAHTRGGQEARIIAFDFTVTQPYQIEYTNLKLRLFAGLSLLTTLPIDGSVFVNNITNTNPAKVYSATALPATWANGNTIVFRQPSIPCSCPLLLNRQFVVANIDLVANTFTLKDPITGNDIDGTNFNYTPVSGGAPDSIEKVFELTTVYTTAQLSDIRQVTNDTSVLVLNPNHQPYLIQQSGSTQWTLTAQDFSDGPYFDINKTTTTLTPSATTGTITITASSTTGINGDLGFLSTDVGRLIRLQVGPAAWGALTVYDKDAIVLGSDGNVYISVAGGNMGRDPTTDTGSFWIISSTAEVWAWVKITVFLTITTVTAVVMGSDLSSTTATATWRLGLYSNSTGWPTCGCYHEGRLWLSSSAFGNRIDGSVSNDYFNFSPTSVEGTVANSNAVAAVANASDVNKFFWMISTDDGLVLGSQAAEWRVRASSLDDPISPTSIQMRRVSNWGCANVEPVQASVNVFVQRLRRKLLAHIQVNDQKYAAENLSHLSDHLISSGVEEIRWQQEPPLTIWNRCTDGSIVGAVFQKGYNTWTRTGAAEDSFSAFFGNSLGDDRIIESISTGASFDGLSTSLFVISNQADNAQPDYNIRWVQCLMPTFDSASKDWEAFFVDGGANPSYAQRMSVTNGDSFDGIRIFGLWHLNGRNAAPVMGGLDLGDRAVANGFADVPFGTDPDKVFTLAFFLGLSNGTDYGMFQMSVSFVDNIGTSTTGIATYGSYTASGTPVPAYRGTYLPAHSNQLNSQWALISPVDTASAVNESLLGLVGSDAIIHGSYGEAKVNAAGTEMVIINRDSGLITQGLRLINLITGDEILSAAPGTIFPAGVTDVPSAANYFHRNGFLYMSGRGGTSNCSPISKVDVSTMTEVAFIGQNNSSFAGSGPYGPGGTLQLQTAQFSMCGPKIGTSDFIVFVGIRSGLLVNEVTLLKDGLGISLMSAMQTDEEWATVCNGRETSSFASVFAKSMPSLSAWPSVWSVGATYGNTLRVFGSNGTIYASLADGNIGNDPVSSPAFWQVQSQLFGFYEFTFTSTTGFVKRKIRTFGPTDIDATWSSFSQGNVVGPAYDRLNNAILVFVETADAVANKHYLVSFDASSGAVKWKLAMPMAVTMDDMEVSLAQIHGTYSILRTDVSAHCVYVVDTTSGTFVTQNWNIGLSSTKQQFAQVFVPPSTLEYQVPLSIGAPFTSRGQLLRPDFGPDAGAQNGPAFGKLRRLHKWAMSFWRSRGVSLGTAFTKLFPVILRTPGKSVISSPTLYSGIISDTIQSDDSYDAQIAWEITRPYPVTILAAGGYIQSSDK